MIDPSIPGLPALGGWDFRPYFSAWVVPIVDHCGNEAGERKRSYQVVLGSNSLSAGAGVMRFEG